MMDRIADDAEAMEIIRRLKAAGYTGEAVARAMDRLEAECTALSKANPPEK
jgi:DNA-binding transcriptional MerR regulator